MPEVDNAIFYRIEPWISKWAEGDTFSIGVDRNRFTKDWQSARIKFSPAQTVTPEYVNLALTKTYDDLVERKQHRIEREEYEKLMLLLKSTLDGIHTSVLGVREYAFEAVRLEKYSQLPSRMHCSFLVPDDPRCVKYWWDELKTQEQGTQFLGERKIFKVKVSGIIHKVSQEHLTPLRTCSVIQWRSLAEKYWGESSDESEEDEILFTGNLSVLERVQISTFGLQKS
ncbi:DUF2441 domain-containing protein [Bremerella sp. T1]|uniref:DUF2441 domain-containing protein n=1 Tax=Bremerella sp. TYQ1 TaxID=3119568 RepID=UPI001CCDA54B|nr:DUF2441 domain-containing protein [Bremerella volcania]UBM35332.1 DUF2441 domain-containing protein [Bremerella volcania]